VESHVDWMIDLLGQVAEDVLATIGTVWPFLL